jgi:RNA-directed DNA polymerase
MDLWPSLQYQREGQKAGCDPEVLSAALEQARRVQARGLAAVLSLRHLAIQTDTPYGYLRNIVARHRDPYRIFSIKKRPAGYRAICVPEADLLRVQRWIHHFILIQAQAHPASFAYGKGCNPRKCAEVHAGSRWLVKLDIRQFFESISEIQVCNTFKGLGYEPLVAFELARLCTRMREIGHGHRGPRWAIRSSSWRIQSYRSLSLGHLPQGAPTSPLLANLSMQRFDESLTRIATSEGLAYTRYSDDVTFSTPDRSFTRHSAGRVVRRVQGVMRSFGLRPRTSKIRIVPPGSRKIVLGLVVIDDGPRLTREFRNSLECHLHFVERFGYSHHAQVRGFDSEISLRHYLLGLLAHAMQIEPHFAEPLRQRLEAVTLAE